MPRTKMSEDIKNALSAFAKAYDLTEEEAIPAILKHWLANHGYLPKSKDDGALEHRLWLVS